MPVTILAQSFVNEYNSELTAAGSIVLALGLVIVTNRFIDRRGKGYAEALDGRISREADTRLRFARRAIDAGIVIIGVAVALSQFTALDRIANTILASGAIAAAIIGFAARQTLANAVAGLFLAITQPLRIGDVVTFEDELGVVEDIRLTTTWLRNGANARIIVPNERLAGGVLRNDSIVDEQVAVEVTLFLSHGAGRVPDALDALRDALGNDVTVRVAEQVPEGTRLLLIAPQTSPAERFLREAELREQGLRALPS